MAGSPTNAVDPSGQFLDVIVDVGFIVWDVVDIAVNGPNAENVAALGADVASALIPFATGGGLLVRGAAHADDVVHAVSGASRTSGFVGDSAKIEDEVLYRYGGSDGISPESLEDLAAAAARAEKDPNFGHGVSSWNRPMRDPSNQARRGDLEASGFPVNNTGRRGHRTIMLPKPLTQEAVDAFNKCFGH